MRAREFAAVLLGVSILGSVMAARQGPPRLRVAFPVVDIGADALTSRQRAQRATISRFSVFNGFHFTDRVTESGITFRHRIVLDAGPTYKLAHYDHGNGVVAADVDGDDLTDLYFISQVGGNELWKNLGDGTFSNITSAAGVALKDRIGVTAAFADIDNDGDQDLFVTTVRGGNVLFENDGRGAFKNITRAAGVGMVAHSSGVVFFDYDKDGLVDLFVCNVGKYTTDRKGPDGAYVAFTDAFQGHLFPGRYEQSVLYRNLGGNRFGDVTTTVGLTQRAWSGDAMVADLNRDGWPDLLVLNMAGSQLYLQNVEGRRFVDATAQYFTKTPMGAMGVASLDFDNDGRMDVFFTDMHVDMLKEQGPEFEKTKLEELRRPMTDMPINMPAEMAPAKGSRALMGMGALDDYVLGNAFYRDTGRGVFEELSDRLRVETYWPWGTSVGDLNADGWPDLFVTGSMNFPYRYGINSVLLNNAGREFLDAEFIVGIEPRKAGRTTTPWYVQDCSAAVRNLNLPGQGGALGPCGARKGTIEVMGALGSRASVIFDLDHDGDLDVVTSDFNSAPQVFLSDLSRQKALHWIAINLVGTVSNRNGLGATVRVVAGAQTYTQYVDGKSGYLSQSALPLYFGLGGASGLDRVEVDWPSGGKQVVRTGLGLNRVLTITEQKPDKP